MDRPSRPWISIGSMKLVVLNPVPQMMQSASWRVPSAVRTPPASTRVIASVWTSTFGRCRAGSQWELKRTRLQPKV
jgi:hypothetical protein